MDKKYWDEVSLKHDEKIFDVFSNDKEQIIQSAIRKYASKKKTVMDLGCAIGNWLPLLASSFKKVYAIDIAEHYIDRAKERNKQFPNIEYIHADFSNKNKALPASDFVVCINTLLTPNNANRNSSYNIVVNLVC